MRKWLTGLVGVALLLGACGGDSGGGSSDDPTEALVAAFRSLGEADSQTLTVSLESTPDSLVAASEGSLTAEAAQTIVDSSLAISGTRGESADDSASRLSLNIPETEGVELIVLGTDLFFRADVRGLLPVFGQDAAMVDQFVQQAKAQGLDFVEAGINGEFLKIEGIDQLTSQLGVSPGDLSEQQQKLLDGFGDAIRRDANVTSEGTDDVGEHLVATISVRDAYQSFQELAEQTSPVPGAFPPPTEVPDKDISVDAWVNDGRLAQIEFDFLQLSDFGDEPMPEGVEQLALRVTFAEEAEEVTAPEDAVTVTQQDLQQLFTGGAPSAPPGGGGGQVPADCSQFENLPPEAFEGLPPETLDLIEQQCPGVVPQQ
jgi:hypothetical protein